MKNAGDFYNKTKGFKSWDDRLWLKEEMIEFAESYYKHKSKAENLPISDVVGQSEQLFCHHEGRYTLKSDGNCCKCHLPPDPNAK